MRTCPKSLAGPADATAPLKGIACMVLGTLILTGSDTIAKWLTNGTPVGQILALRSAVVVVFAIVIAHRIGGVGQFRWVNHRGQFARAFFACMSTLLFVVSLQVLPLADAIAVTFISPLLITALAFPMLGERVGRHRWSAVLIGFLGVLLIARPGTEGFEPYILLPLAAALFGALRDLMTRSLARTDTGFSMLLAANVFVLAGGLVTLPSGWVAMSLTEFALLFAAGLLVGAAHLLHIDAFRFTDASLVAPFKYTALVWAVAFGFLVWGESPDATVLGGAVIVTGSGLYILYRERVVRTTRHPPAATH